MEHLTPLNSKETKNLFETINEFFGTALNHDSFSYILMRSAQGRIFAVSKSLSGIPLEKLKINNVGIYFCDDSEALLRVSIEGAQLIGNKATKNILEMTKENIKRWLLGEDMELEQEHENGAYLIRYGKDFYGCGIIKNNKLLNFVPKQRRLNNVELV